MNLPDRLREILAEQHLTVYGAAQLISAKTNEPIKTVHQRITRYCRLSPESWESIEKILSILGYEIVIKKRARR